MNFSTPADVSQLFTVSLTSHDWSSLCDSLHHRRLYSHEDKGRLHVKSSCSVFALLIRASSISACLCTLMSAAAGYMVWYPNCRPSVRRSRRSQRSSCASEVDWYYSIFWRWFCCLDWHARGPKHCAEFSMAPGPLQSRPQDSNLYIHY